MRAVGLDPSLTNTGVVLLDGDDFVSCTTVKTRRGSVPARYLYIEKMIGKVIRDFKPEVVGCERYITGKESSEDLYALQVMLQMMFVRQRCRAVMLLPDQWRHIFHNKAYLQQEKRKSKGDMDLDLEMDFLESQVGDKSAAISRMKDETGCRRANSHEAEAYFIARTAQRFFGFVDGDLLRDDLTESERFMFDRKGPKDKNLFDDADPARDGILNRRNVAWFDFRSDKDLSDVMATLDKKSNKGKKK